jgi:hypothetical protein
MSDLQSKKLKRDATYEELFIHLHIPKKNLRAASEGTQDKDELEEGRRRNDVTIEDDTNVEVDDSEQSSDITRSLNFPDPKAREIYVSICIYVSNLNFCRFRVIIIF